MSALTLAMPTYAQEVSQSERIQALEEKVEVLTEMVESQSAVSESTQQVHLGGYGEMHLNLIKGDDEEKRGLDFHRLVLFVGYDFSDRIRLVTELEIEHAVSSASKAGEVEVEQAYLEFDLNAQRNQQLKTGILLMPVGLINETHEPTTFYGVERPIIETTLLPSTWWGGGVMFSHQLTSGVSYDLFVSEGLKTQDPNVSATNDPFDLKAGKQKTTSTAGNGGKADAFDFATTARVKYTAIPGLELSAYAQYQPDLDQSAKNSYADSAVLLGAHVIYAFSDFKATALYARWDLQGDAAKAAGKDVQDGGYVELSYQPFEQWGFFVRQSEWKHKVNEEARQTDLGVNYWPHPQVVFKADYQVMNQYAAALNDSDITTKAYAFNLGMGYHF